MKRKEKRSRKFHGTRSHGTGNAKNKRGSGNRGGVGWAGGSAHKLAYTLKYEPAHYGARGFHCPTSKKQGELNLYEIESMIKKGKLKQEGEKYLLEFAGKLLGEGEISSPLLAKVGGASKSAMEKIKKAGGEVIAKKKEAVHGQP